MSTFIILCLIAVAYADTVGHSDTGLSVQPRSGLNRGFSNNPPGLSYDVPSQKPLVTYNKKFYTFSAPKEADEEVLVPVPAGILEPGVSVYYVKKSKPEDADLALDKQAADQKTDALNKQAGMRHLVNKRNALSRNNNNKPEVHFGKYRNPEEAAMQFQYDSLAGSSQSVLNFAS